MKPNQNLSRNGTRWLAGLVMAAGMVTPPAEALQLSLEPATASVAPGAGVDLTLTISGLGVGGAPSLGAFDVSISFNPGVLSYDSVTFGDPVLGNQLGLTTASSDGSAVDSVGGLVNLFSVSLDGATDLDGGQADSFILASLHFTALAGGVSPLGLSDIILGDAAGAELLPDAVRGSQVRVVTAVPEGGMFLPGFFLLTFATGCTWLRRWRNGRE